MCLNERQEVCSDWWIVSAKRWSGSEEIPRAECGVDENDGPATEFRPSLRKLKATIGWAARKEPDFRFVPRTKDKKIRELWCGQISTMKHTGPRHCFTQVPRPDADPR